MIPLGTIDGSPSHTLLKGDQIDSWDAHSGTSRCYHRVFVSASDLFVHREHPSPSVNGTLLD